MDTARISDMRFTMRSTSCSSRSALTASTASPTSISASRPYISATSAAVVAARVDPCGTVLSRRCNSSSASAAACCPRTVGLSPMLLRRSGCHSTVRAPPLAPFAIRPFGV
eukprot:477946-Prymnesium_polylepis.1